MTPGPTVIRRCSACSQLIAQWTLASGNTLGAKIWTDGKRKAPMLPEAPWLVKCRHCSALVWIDEQEEVEELLPWEAGEGRAQGALAYLTPELGDYERLSRDSMQPRDKQRYLRRCIWWLGNDARRGVAQPSLLSEAEQANLEGLVGLLDEAVDEDRIVKAEVLRELGRFEDAVKLLMRRVAPELEWAATFLRDLAAKRDPRLRELPDT